ncbi:midasin [Hypoxylon sp. FL1857]|nr:midasin [Hypoxylon sp. FL1857]
MAVIDVSAQRRQLLAHMRLFNELPPDLLEIIRSQTPANFLDAIAAAALIPQFTGLMFIYFESVFADICARWLPRPRNGGQEDTIIAAFARILPFAPHLSVFLEQYLSETSLTNGHGSRPLQINSLNSLEAQQYSAASLTQILLAFWRLLNFEKRTFSQLVLPSRIQALLKHGYAPVRYLAIRVLCLQLNASDYKLEELIREHIKEGESLVGDFDGAQTDYTLLSLIERQRAEQLDKAQLKLRAESDKYKGDDFPPQQLTKLVAQYNLTILPRPNGEPHSPSSLVYTPTTLANLENLAQNLQKPGPILLHGLPGSGKTSIVHEIARELGTESSLVTLHLNEQTDAKMLIGLYSTGSKPGSFSWRPGVLTTAVREGRWVLIEDLDRAPNEVMSTLLPLVEHGNLLIPSRGETVEAPSSFRLFATVRTTRGMNGQESLPSMLGQRFWHLSSVKIPPPAELEQIIVGSYPLLHKYTPTIMSVYRRLCNLSSLPPVSNAGRSTVERSITPRDVLKWCRRLKETLLASGCKTGDEPISETTRDWMFMDAVDCFCGSLPRPDARAALVSCIAEEMHLSKQLMEHYLKAHVPQIEESPSSFKVGRVMLTRRKHANRIVKSRKPFASTSHSRRLLEQISMAVKLREPVLLVGETGIGKTTVIQQLAESLGHKLVAVNLSQQSEVGDLLGGFKPVNARSLAVPLKEEFEDLFASTGISASKNQKYLEQIGKCTAKGQWTRVSKLWREAPKMFNKIVSELQSQAEARNDVDSDGRPAAKRRKVQSRLQSLLDLKPRWEAFAKSLEQFDIQISGGSGAFAFAFVEGNIVKAARNGDWVLLDEINLASPDTLESIADLLASGPNDEPSILLSETGDIERVKAHPDFRIFGAMNPATDIGKRDLPLGLRSRFTEFYVSSPDKDLKDLLTIIKAYLSGKSAKDEQAADDIARLYLNTKTRAEEKRLVDGANEVPHFSLRTLTRVLSYVNDVSPFYGLRRALYEGFSMGFLTLLDRASEETLVPLIHHHLLDRHGSARSLLSQPPKHPNDGKQYVKFVNKNKDRQYWLLQGEETPIERSDYIITPYIERNLLNLVRATSTRRFPILIQGPTSAGKTSMIEYLANFSGNKFVRINNHEHTDLQEYLGTYVSDADGKLRFQEGLLVQALRQGHWIVLDELNLAPTDVLEALNRLLDDNRELLIPETQEVVRPHENFMLFATQNPPGLYGGRKVLSRAFRNRFLELHFDDIPEDELEIILQKRSLYTAPSDCKRIVNVYKELSRLRQTSRLFENKDSFATLRDLFRWALRGAETREEIAANGFMLLAERVRNEEERMAVKKVIEMVFKVKIDQNQLYDIRRSPYLQAQPPNNGQGVVWTQAMRRLYVLVASALRHNEPVLLVGETGCGKTTVCQLLAESLGKELHIVNAHQNTETGDLIGSQRPIRNRGAIVDVLTQDLANALQQLGQMTEGNLEVMLEKYHALDELTRSKLPVDLQRRISDNEVKSKALFEWADGSLVHAMRDGQFFLLDEISLADDSVLERLNSVLEPQRSLLLAEKGIDDSFVKASEGFQFLATMNPGGDFGKKELSPALRNRFTEIWVPPLSENEDVLQIVSLKLRPEFQSASKVIVEFSYWFGQNFRSTASTAFSIRDILVWVKFVNESAGRDLAFSVIHGAATVFIDTLGANPSALIAIDPRSMDTQRQRCLDKLSELLRCDATAVYRAPLELTVKASELRIGDFSIERTAHENFEAGFALHAPTTKLNAMRIIRALQVQKPILLEGSPGVGKTTLVSALAKACGRPLTRINLSDQTDLMDLFGTDVPIEGAEAGHFAWRDAPFLRAMQNGEWVLLDEMNLASQSVLEGLNACLDHRGEVYVSELDQVFKRHPDFRLFAAQNPHHQGGGRKGLPSSFVNRFIVVYADVFSEEDLLLIAQHNFPKVSGETVRQMITFISNLETRILVERAFGAQGSPWEFNLRDTLRWLHLLTSPDPLLKTGKVDDFLNIAIRQRFRTERDRLEVDKLFTEAFQAPPKGHQLYHNMSSSFLQVGLALMQRNQLVQPSQFPGMDVVPRLMEIESILICIKQNIPCILVGPSGSGKSMLLQHIAASCGKSLVTFPMNADIDAMDLVGGFEQSDPMRDINTALRELQEALQLSTASALVEGVPDSAVDLLNVLDSVSDQIDGRQDMLGLIENLRGQISADTELAATLSNVHALLQRSIGISNPRFEWLDGIIVKALQKGHWLVLDNANLCSASVLDRLNSLLEPDGYLIINEHCGPNGEPQVIKPHPDFRVFLTVDPRYGELSRAMRNRAVEIYIEPHGSSSNPWRSRVADVESSLKRYELLSSVMFFDDNYDTYIQSVAVDSLSFSDLPLLENAKSSLRSINAVNGVFLTSHAKAEVSNSIRNLYATLSMAIAPGFESIQPLHPLQNSVIVPLLQESFPELPFWLATCYELYIDVVDARGRVELEDTRGTGKQVSQLNRFQRSRVAGSVAAVSKDSTVGAAKFVIGFLDEIDAFMRSHFSNPGSWKDRKYFFRDLMHYWWRTASFQAHLSLISNGLSAHISRAGDDEIREFASRILKGLDECFISGFKLSTGLSMEILWKSVLDNFDLVKWQSKVAPSDLAQIMDSFVKIYRSIRLADNDTPTAPQIVLLDSISRQSDLPQPSNEMMRNLSNNSSQKQYWDENLSANVFLGSLASLEAELPILAKQISSNAESIAADRLDKLSEVLWHLMMNLVAVWDPSLAAAFAAAKDSYEARDGLSLNINEFLRNIAIPGDKASQSMNRRTCLANAWVQFSIALIKLFVPDKAYDPQLRPQLELKSHEELRDFEKFFTGQSTNLRSELLEEEVEALGPPPTAVQVIQAEFNNLLNVILKSDISSILSQHCSGSEVATQQLHVIHENKHRAYEDITSPVVNMIHCLELGLYLGQEAGPRIADRGLTSRTLLNLTPLLGGKLEVPTFLHYISMVVAVEGSSGLEKLEADQKAEESKNSWYRYRGGLNEEEAAEQEAFDELFPTKYPKISDARALAVKLAQPTESIISLNKLFATKVSATIDSTVDDRDLLPATFLALDERLQEIGSNACSAEYNFYTNGNLPEARKLVGLINEIRARFRQLQQADEIGHLQPLADIVLSYPLAKTILKVEQLHAFTYGALPLYNRLTDLLVGWRRLELSTWGKLFDMEVKKCNEDANSWWFIAYQVIIAHATSLLKELESRLSLLKQIHRQLQFLTTDYPSMSIIQDSLQNFIDFYSRYTKAVDDQIRAGRGPLEKQMKDVLLLASWKDTNIVALRESARKSHQKLFRIVRKFREVLGRPMKPIIEGGLPDEVPDETQTTELQVEAASVDPAAIKLCSRSITGWMDDYRRLANVQRTTEIMSRLSRIPESALDASEAIDSFLSNLESSALELRKETPGVLTDENKALVKHLKSRKRKLFAETLKEARQMGIQYNLSTDVLSRQNALSTVLATSQAFPSLSFKELKSTDYYFHRMLDLAPRVRGASKDHSEDLTIAEVDRSIGFLEGILHITLGQRRELAKALKHYTALSTHSKHISSISTLRSGDNVKTRTLSGNHERASIWLVQIIKVGIHLVELHAKLGNTDNKEVVSLLQKWLENLNALSTKWSSLPILPNGLTSLEKSQLEASISSTLNAFRAELDDACQQWPALAFVFEQIQLWTIVNEESIPTSSLATKQVDFILGATKNLCDSILITIEQFNKTVIKLPTSQEETGWLTKYGETVAASIRALRMDSIERSISGILDCLAQVDLADASVNNISTSLMAVINPIIDQYQATCNQSIKAFIRVHRNTCKLGYKLSKSFTQLASQGFCTPQEKSDETSGETGQLESGTGLGEGEGAEDISKDIQPDEDLSELAQEANKDPNQEMEDEKDAVDMADQELEGDMESIDGGDDKEEGSKSGDEDESGDEMDEEAGEVDDLDPSAVDEKMWDGENEEDAEKEQQGENSKGRKKKDEQVAADAQKDAQELESAEDQDQGDEDMDENPAAEDEDVQQQDETEKQDQNVQEQDTLALPDDMNIDGNDNDSVSSLSDDELDKLSDVNQEEQNEKQMSDLESEDGEDAEMDMAPADASNDAEEMDENAEKEEDANIQEDKNADEEPENQTEERETAELPSNGEINPNNEDAAPSDVKSGGQDQDLNQTEETNNAESNATQQEDGEMGENAADQETSAGKKGSVSKAQEQAAETELDDTRDSSTSQPFKALGDALEKWHRQQREIKEAQEQESQQETSKPEQESTIREFQHIQNDESAAEAQAMGTANEEHMQQIDESMAIDDEDQPADSRIVPEDEVETDDMDVDKMDTSEPLDHEAQQETQKEEKPTGVSTHQGTYNRDMTPPVNGEQPSEEVEEEIQETSTQLSITHLSEPSMDLRDFEEAMHQWTSFQSKTHPLSLALTSQLRLILTPSQSTKLSGSHRTGKRLNIKRIIPYIASSYKRDKIWMRRAIPTKRAYQILLCVDDSKSMGESSSGELALESLVMVSRALTMLEVGQIGVLGFGANTFMAHEFTEPFASHDAGAKVLQKFTFQQDYTDIQLLIKQTIERFRLARQQSTSRGSEDLWQLALILSDGLTPSSAHEHIRLLLREAMEERIMIVFIIMDDTTNSKDKQSVINLKKVRFMGNDEIKTEYYLDTFPFQYYLIVHNLEDLPGALAGLLRTWFAEVNS